MHFNWKVPEACRGSVVPNVGECMSYLGKEYGIRWTGKAAILARPIPWKGMTVLEVLVRRHTVSGVSRCVRRMQT